MLKLIHIFSSGRSCVRRLCGACLVVASVALISCGRPPNSGAGTGVWTRYVRTASAIALARPSLHGRPTVRASDPGTKPIISGASNIHTASSDGSPASPTELSGRNENSAPVFSSPGTIPTGLASGASSNGSFGSNPGSPPAVAAAQPSEAPPLPGKNFAAAGPAGSPAGVTAGPTFGSSFPGLNSAARANAAHVSGAAPTAAVPANAAVAPAPSNSSAVPSSGADFRSAGVPAANSAGPATPPTNSAAGRSAPPENTQTATFALTAGTGGNENPAPLPVIIPPPGSGGGAVPIPPPPDTIPAPALGNEAPSAPLSGNLTPTQSKTGGTFGPNAIAANLPVEQVGEASNHPPGWQPTSTGQGLGFKFALINIAAPDGSVTTATWDTSDNRWAADAFKCFPDRPGNPDAPIFPNDKPKLKVENAQLAEGPWTTTDTRETNACGQARTTIDLGESKDSNSYDKTCRGYVKLTATWSAPGENGSPRKYYRAEKILGCKNFGINEGDYWSDFREPLIYLQLEESAGPPMLMRLNAQFEPEN